MRRQIVWLMTDTTRYDMVGCYGNPEMKTPHLDDLAADGVRFDRAYSAQPVCGPARSLLFTGLYPHENGSWGNGLPLGQGVKTLGQRLHAAGIPAAYIGKWHLDGGDYFGNGVCPDGWDADYWYDMRRYLEELGSDEARVRSRRSRSCFEDGGVASEFTYAHRCVDRALRYLDAHAQEDFFLVVSLDEPHGPSLCPEPFASMYEANALPDTPACHDTLEGKPQYQRLWAQAAAQKHEAGRARLLLGCNSFADHQLGRVIDRVRAQLPDAMILFTSDHGAALGAHGLCAKGPSVYDEIARVPLIFSGGPCQAGTVCPATVSHADIPATVLDYMGLPIPSAFTGHSLMDVLRGYPAPAAGQAFVEFNRYERDHDGFGGLQLMRAVITDRYKLALHLTDRDELYDIEKDPYNLHNLIEDPAYAKARDALHDHILQWMNDTRDPFRGYQWQCRPWRQWQPDWEVDGCTRQPENEPGELRQLDYDTGLAIASAVRHKQTDHQEGKRV